ncbi:MAG: flagellin N-terminal helical domain-containing protein [Planctomycetota bacterium]|jgi:flagellin-like hook-associated protein FlgL
MSTIPTNLARVPNVLASQIVLGALQKTQQSLLNTQIQLATGRQVNRASDDALAASTISVLDDVIERRDQWLRNLSHADSVMGNLDAALGDASELLIEAKGIASSQIGIGSDQETRQNQAAVIDSMVNEMFSIANRQFQEVFFFGGNATARPPMVELLSGLRYRGEGDGLVTDVGQARAIEVTISAADAFGALSTRVQGQRDLDPIMVGTTRLVDMGGARGFGIGLGSINVDVGGTDVTLDLSNVHTIGDVVSELETAILSVPAGVGTTVQIDPVTQNRIEITGNGVAITISDLAADATAADLGINMTFAPGGDVGADLDPRLTELTPVSSLAGVTVPLGTIRVINGGQTRDLDLSGAVTVQDIINGVEGLNLGVRVEIAETGDRLDFINELSGGQMSIAEVGGGSTATELGVRSLASWTRLEDFNNGRGVQIRSGSVDPVTGLPDPTADLDFRITVKDGRSFDVDLAGAETVGDVLDAINSAAGIAGVPATADLAADGNGIELTDLAAGPGTTSIEALNGSFAAADLGILGSTTGATLVGEDRATVAVESVFSHLMSLRDALLANDERGITLAAERFEQDISQLAEARAQVGVRSRRVTDAINREEDLRIQDMALRSQVQDLDYTEAALRFSTLQQQLQAGLLTANEVTSLSLLDFLR